MAHILLLEDEFVLANSYKEILEKKGHEVVTFGRGEKAKEYFEAEKVDLIIADLFIKEGDQFEKFGGITLISWIKQLQGSDVPIIAISAAFGSGSTVDHATMARGTAITVGATVTLPKPFADRELTDLVDEVLARSPVQ